jgi:hypothetical protein
MCRSSFRRKPESSSLPLIFVSVEVTASAVLRPAGNFLSGDKKLPKNTCFVPTGQVRAHPARDHRRGNFVDVAEAVAG